MAPKRRSSETGEQIILQGCLIKSPPAYIINKRASWKQRLFKLCRTGVGSVILRYYAYNGVSEEWKGDIYMSDIKSIELGNSAMERIPTITRLFDNSPNNVLCLKTDRRDYFLVDNSGEKIAEWQKYLTDTWVQVNQKATIEGPTSPSTNLLKVMQDQEEATRPKSYPENYPRTGTALVEESNRQRSHTDPRSWEGKRFTLDDYRALRHENSIEENVLSEHRKSQTLGICCQIPSEKTHLPHEGRRRSSASSFLQADPVRSRLSDDMTDPAYDSESESIYDTPRSIALQMSVSRDSADEEQTSDLDSEEGGVYERMSSLFIDETTNFETTPPRDVTVTPKARVVDEATNLATTSALNVTVTPKTRYSKTQGSQLKKTHILKLMYEAQSECDLVQIKVTMPTEHLQKYLGLTEVGEHLCVSKWKGPLQIGCLFHHGDHIDSINGFRPGGEDFFFQMLSNSISSEVNLVLTRHKKADVFHLEGCSCGRL